jgi:hypothetical protein
MDGWVAFLDLLKAIKICVLLFVGWMDGRLVVLKDCYE